jgi:predicted RNA-binding Zn-ribbon protein involved in translation (DUF1610 family)
MRQSLPQFSVNENLPECPACGATTVFAHAADFARNGRVYMIFTCPACGAGETKVWRPEWQAFADALTVDEE